MEQVLRPYGVILDGFLQLGLEVVLEGRAIRDVRPHTGLPEPYVLSPAFVNAHSHLEYRGLQGALWSREYWPWIREITAAKREQAPQQVAADCRLAASENAATGVALIAEHSDRAGATAALREQGMEAVVFQELITRFDPNGPQAVLSRAGKRVGESRSAGVPAHLAPHAFHTVDESTLRSIAASEEPFSIHVAESDLENELCLSGSGAIAETLRDLGVDFTPTGLRLVSTLADLGLVREGAQFVHCCAIDRHEISVLAAAGVCVAHCPRSNERLGCPPAPVREMLDAGVRVGLGMDSAASSGPIDMFEEMRAALRVSLSRGRALTPEEVWHMATTGGAESLRPLLPDLGSWRIEPGAAPPMIQISVPDATSTEELIERGSPASLVRQVVPLRKQGARAPLQ